MALSLASVSGRGGDCGEEPLLSSSLDVMQECGRSVARSFEFSEVKYLNFYEKALDIKMLAANSDFKKHYLGQHCGPNQTTVQPATPVPPHAAQRYVS